MKAQIHAHKLYVSLRNKLAQAVKFFISHFCTNCHGFIGKHALDCKHCGALTVLINFERIQLTEYALNKKLIDRALDVSQNERIWGYISAMQNAITSITNEAYVGRRMLLREDYIPVPFKSSWELKDKLIAILADQCMKYDTLTPLEIVSGWRTDVVAQIALLAEEYLS